MRLWLVVLAMLWPMAGGAQVRPVPGTGDPRLQTIAYAPDQVVELTIASGTALMVTFAGGERVETVALGDSGSWQVTPTKRGDAIFIKTLGGGDSSMTVVTDARTYLFQLTSGGFGGAAPLVVRFTYAAAEPAVPAMAPADVRYRIRGNRAIRPSSIVAEGSNIAISWPAVATMPAVFRIDDGQEALVNGETKEGRYVVEGRPDKLVFRLDRLLATAERLDQRTRR